MHSAIKALVLLIVLACPFVVSAQDSPSVQQYAPEENEGEEPVSAPVVSETPVAPPVAAPVTPLPPKGGVVCHQEEEIVIFYYTASSGGVFENSILGGEIIDVSHSGATSLATFKFSNDPVFVAVNSTSDESASWKISGVTYSVDEHTPDCSKYTSSSSKISFSYSGTYPDTPGQQDPIKADIIADLPGVLSDDIIFSSGGVQRDTTWTLTVDTAHATSPMAALVVLQSNPVEIPGQTLTGVSSAALVDATNDVTAPPPTSSPPSNPPPPTQAVTKTPVPSGLSGGAIAGIVIGSVAGALIIAVVIYIIISNSGSSSSSPAASSKPASKPAPAAAAAPKEAAEESSDDEEDSEEEDSEEEDSEEESSEEESSEEESSEEESSEEESSEEEDSEEEDSEEEDSEEDSEEEDSDEESE